MNTRTLFCLITGCSIQLAVAGPTTHCKEAEQVIFSCAIAGSQKVVSLCGNTKKNGLAWVQYRFGKVGALEMSYPAKKESSLSKFGIRLESHSAPPLFTLNEIWFSVNSYSYIITNTVSTGNQDYPANNENGHRQESGILIYKNEREHIAKHKCALPVTDRLNKLSNHISNGYPPG